MSARERVGTSKRLPAAGKRDHGKAEDRENLYAIYARESSGILAHKAFQAIRAPVFFRPLLSRMNIARHLLKVDGYRNRPFMSFMT